MSIRHPRPRFVQSAPMSMADCDPRYGAGAHRHEWSDDDLKPQRRGLRLPKTMPSFAEPVEDQQSKE